jgi:chemotaxis protein histidine kinase CheA
MVALTEFAATVSSLVHTGLVQASRDGPSTALDQLATQLAVALQAQIAQRVSRQERLRLGGDALPPSQQQPQQQQAAAGALHMQQQQQHNGALSTTAVSACPNGHGKVKPLLLSAPERMAAAAGSTAVVSSGGHGAVGGGGAAGLANGAAAVLADASTTAHPAHPQPQQQQQHQQHQNQQQQQLETKQSPDNAALAMAAGASAPTGGTAPAVAAADAPTDAPGNGAGGGVMSATALALARGALSARMQQHQSARSPYLRPDSDDMALLEIDLASLVDFVESNEDAPQDSTDAASSAFGSMLQRTLEGAAAHAQQQQPPPSSQQQQQQGEEDERQLKHNGEHSAGGGVGMSAAALQDAPPQAQGPLTFEEEEEEQQQQHAQQPPTLTVQAPPADATGSALQHSAARTPQSAARTPQSNSVDVDEQDDDDLMELAGDGTRTESSDAGKQGGDMSGGPRLRRKGKELSFADVSRHFDLPLTQAAEKLNVCVTLVKRVCRENGVSRWPYRKLQSRKKKARIAREAIGNPASDSLPSCALFGGGTGCMPSHAALQASHGQGLTAAPHTPTTYPLLVSGPQTNCQALQHTQWIGGGGSGLSGGGGIGGGGAVQWHSHALAGGQGGHQWPIQQ